MKSKYKIKLFKPCCSPNTLTQANFSLIEYGFVERDGKFKMERTDFSWSLMYAEAYFTINLLMVTKVKNATEIIKRALEVLHLTYHEGKLRYFA